MTPAARIDEARATVDFMRKHRDRHERRCGCMLAQRPDGSTCEQGRAILDTLREARERLRAGDPAEAVS